MLEKIEKETDSRYGVLKKVPMCSMFFFVRFSVISHLHG